MQIRAPFQVLVVPFVRRPTGGYQFAVLRRSDERYWQAIAGGGSLGESPEEAARRETLEETGIPSSANFYRLTSVHSVPVATFLARDRWPSDLYVIPEFSFAVESLTLAIVLSKEHSESRWASYSQAYRLLHWDSNKVALWELHERLRTGDLPTVLH